MKANFKVILAIGVAAFLAFPTMTKAQGTVTSFRAVPSAGTVPFDFYFDYGLALSIACHTPQVLIEFDNRESGDTTLNFFYSDGTTVNASGVVLPPLPQVQFQAPFENGRIEGQFIFAGSSGNTTINLHAFDGGTFCEIQGTAEHGG